MGCIEKVIAKNILQLGILVAVSTLFFGIKGEAAGTLRVDSLVDSLSIVTNISVPFTIKNTASGVSLKEVKVQNSTTCRTLIDPYITTNFFIKCTIEGDIYLEVSYLESGAAKKVAYGPIYVAKISETGTVVDDDSAGATSADTLKGQELWNKSEGSYRSCTSCHGSPSNKKSVISTTTLDAAYSSTTMSTSAIRMTTSEKQILINYVKSYK